MHFFPLRKTELLSMAVQLLKNTLQDVTCLNIYWQQGTFFRKEKQKSD